MNYVFTILISALAISKIIKSSFPSISKNSREVPLILCCLQINILFSSMDSVSYYQSFPKSWLAWLLPHTSLSKVSETIPALVCLGCPNKIPQMQCLQ